ncbi:hypothetical protein BC835DRAFT_900123 [Cytidiella melzeri]|nr:hypothetical protein BC835DRAFT_900123 [Cytidiella melzeri]
MSSLGTSVSSFAHIAQFPVTSLPAAISLCMLPYPCTCFMAKPIFALVWQNAQSVLSDLRLASSKTCSGSKPQYSGYPGTVYIESPGEEPRLSDRSVDALRKLVCPVRADGIAITPELQTLFKGGFYRACSTNPMRFTTSLSKIFMSCVVILCVTAILILLMYSHPGLMCDQVGVQFLQISNYFQRDAYVRHSHVQESRLMNVHL